VGVPADRRRVKMGE